MLVAKAMVYGSFFYLAIGAIFSLWFVTRRIGRFDPAAAGTGMGFRAIIFFGATALWILLAVKLLGRR